MKTKSIPVILATDYRVSKILTGYGTRPQRTIIKSFGRRIFLVKCNKRGLGELRSEVCASAIGHIVGLPAQETSLCRLEKNFQATLGLPDSRGVLCKIDIRSRKDRSRQHNDIEEAWLGEQILDNAVAGYSKLESKSDRRRAYTLENIDTAVGIFEKEHAESIDVLKPQFFEMCIFDAIIGGTDRHERNWGVLFSLPSKKFIRMINYFDNGISLLWDLEKNNLKNIVAFDNRAKGFIRNTKSAFRRENKQSSQYTCFEACEWLLERGYYPDRKVSLLKSKLQTVLKNIKLRHALVDMMPKDPDFLMTENALSWIHEYTCLRIQMVIAMLEGRPV